MESQSQPTIVPVGLDAFHTAWVVLAAFALAGGVAAAALLTSPTTKELS